MLWEDAHGVSVESAARTRGHGVIQPRSVVLESHRLHWCGHAIDDLVVGVNLAEIHLDGNFIRRETTEINTRPRFHVAAHGQVAETRAVENFGADLRP